MSNAKNVPKYIKAKCERMAELCQEAYVLRHEVEAWCEKNGIDIYSSEAENTLYNDCGGCNSVITVDGIEDLLQKQNEE